MTGTWQQKQQEEKNKGRLTNAKEKTYKRGGGVELKQEERKREKHEREEK